MGRKERKKQIPLDQFLEEEKEKKEKKAEEDRVDQMLKKACDLRIVPRFHGIVETQESFPINLQEESRVWGGGDNVVTLFPAAPSATQLDQKNDKSRQW